MASPSSGAIFTTVADGSEVNFNIYSSKEAVYLDGGPGPGAPQHAAGLDDGRYVFQVTDPSGKRLLSTDAARCRMFDVNAGGLQVTWTDTLGAANNKSSYHNASLNVNHEAHVEAPEDGAHRISIPAQPGCNVGFVYVNGIRQEEPGPQQVTVIFPKTTKPLTIFVEVQCIQ